MRDINLSRGENDHPDGLYIGNCKMCGVSFMGPKKEPACAKCSKEVVTGCGGTSVNFEQRRKDNDQLQQLDKVIESTEGALKRLHEMRREVINRLGINKETESALMRHELACNMSKLREVGDDNQSN